MKFWIQQRRPRHNRTLSSFFLRRPRHTESKTVLRLSVSLNSNFENCIMATTKRNSKKRGSEFVLTKSDPVTRVDDDLDLDLSRFCSQRQSHSIPFLFQNQYHIYGFYLLTKLIMVNLQWSRRDHVGSATD